MKKHLVFVINPRSGVERKKEIEAAIKEHLNQDIFSYELQFTQYAKHGTGLAQEAALKGAYAIVAVGGDGSVNDIMKGILGTNAALAIIPKGSGNGMARSLQIPFKVHEAIEVINAGQSLMMDIAFANNEPFISNAGVAFDALISKKFAKSKRRGFVVYSWLVTKYLWLYKAWNWKIEIDGKAIERKSFMVIVANGKQFGYNFQIAPKASWTDGLLDIVIVKRFPKMLGGLIALRAFKGSILRSPYVEHYTAKEVTISHPKLSLMQMDGDAHACSKSVQFRIQPAAMKVLVP